MKKWRPNASYSSSSMPSFINNILLLLLSTTTSSLASAYQLRRHNNFQQQQRQQSFSSSSSSLSRRHLQTTNNSNSNNNNNKYYLLLELTFDSSPTKISWKFENARTKTILAGKPFGAYDTSMANMSIKVPLEFMTDDDLRNDPYRIGQSRDYRFVIYDMVSFDVVVSGVVRCLLLRKTNITHLHTSYFPLSLSLSISTTTRSSPTTSLHSSLFLSLHLPT